MLVPPESSSAVLVVISSKSVSICNCFHARRANSGKITISKGYPSLMLLFEGNLLTQRHQVTSYETRNSGAITLGYHMVKTLSLCLTWPWIGTVPGRDRQTDWQTGRIARANTRSQQYLPVQLSRVKMFYRKAFAKNVLTDLSTIAHCLKAGSY